MADARTVAVGHELILFTSHSDLLSEGHSTGYLECHDERHRPAFPLASHTVCDHLMRIWGNQSEPPLWRAGRMTGWIQALTENAPETFVGMPVSEEVTVFAGCGKKR